MIHVDVYRIYVHFLHGYSTHSTVKIAECYVTQCKLNHTFLILNTIFVCKASKINNLHMAMLAHPLIPFFYGYKYRYFSVFDTIYLHKKSPFNQILKRFF